MSDEINSEKLLKLRNKFLCCVPINEIGLQGCLSSISWADQDLFLNQTIKSDLLQKFPIKSTYQKAFLKSLIEILEKNFIEVHDNLYIAYCDILGRRDSEKYYYKHYMVDGVVITLKENKNIISEGTTGLCSWKASIALSQWCLNNKQKLQNKTILELGSGIGLVGLTIIQHCQPKEVFLSDCHPRVLSVLSENVSINISNSLNKVTNSVSEQFDSLAVGNTVKKTSGLGFGSSGSVSCGSAIKDSNLVDCDNKRQFEKDSDVLLSIVKDSVKVSVLNLPWEGVENLKCCEKILPDFILAADVVYDNSVFEPLCGAVKYFLGRNCRAQVVFACTERNSDTLQEFLKLLGTHQFRITNLATPKPENFFWSSAVPIRFFLVTAT